MVHRLDVGTSGPLLVARTVEAWNWAKDRIYKRDQLRDYVALVHGSFKSRNAEGGEGLEERGVVLANIDDAGYTKYSRVEISEAAGESATTFYEALAEYQSESGRDSSHGASPAAACGGQNLRIKSSKHMAAV
ncbi:unnamed protein product [Polarella glacialis]|uniref:Pseudouridine synthase RsuA/RluA-like domain-containing protein n=1 Tax=Polarella glacialis TaxID=89957 RepID=A0A813F5J3_POLGL|nr:unnamed protein product [Polarella glacialis]